MRQAGGGHPARGKTPGGIEVRAILKHVIRRIRRHWPKTRICWRGDSHYARPEAMDWCEANGVDYIFGLAGNDVLHAMVRGRRRRSLRAPRRGRRGEAADLDEFRYAAKSWTKPRRVVARLEATSSGFDARYIVTTLEGSAKHLYETIYCARGQAENFIKLHKTQLASDRTSCRSPRANQFRLILHTAAYWLLHTLRAAAPKRSSWRTAEFTTLRLRLIKIAARVVEGAARIRVWLPTACPDAAIFRLLAGRFAAAGP